jgi:hypothetical protein
MVTVAGPSVAEPLALMVSVGAAAALVTLTGSALNVAVTPLGNPESDSITLPVNPLVGAIVIVLVLLFRRTTVNERGAADKMKPGGEDNSDDEWPPPPQPKAPSAAMNKIAALLLLKFTRMTPTPSLNGCS